MKLMQVINRPMIYEVRPTPGFRSIYIFGDCTYTFRDPRSHDLIHSVCVSVCEPPVCMFYVESRVETC